MHLKNWSKSCEELGTAILNMAGGLNITYYDAAYLIEAQGLNKTLVTDDENPLRQQRV